MDIYDDYKSQGYYFIATWNNSIATFDSWYDSTGMEPFTNYYYDNVGAYGAFGAQFGWTSGTPKAVLIDRDGNGRLVAQESVPDATWRSAIEQLL